MPRVSWTHCMCLALLLAAPVAAQQTPPYAALSAEEMRQVLEAGGFTTAAQTIAWDMHAAYRAQYDASEVMRDAMLEWAQAQLIDFPNANPQDDLYGQWRLWTNIQHRWHAGARRLDARLLRDLQSLDPAAPGEVARTWRARHRQRVFDSRFYRYEWPVRVMLDDVRRFVEETLPPELVSAEVMSILDTWEAELKPLIHDFDWRQVTYARQLGERGIAMNERRQEGRLDASSAEEFAKSYAEYELLARRMREINKRATLAIATILPEPHATRFRRRPARHLLQFVEEAGALEAMFERSRARNDLDGARLEAVELLEDAFDASRANAEARLERLVEAALAPELVIQYNVAWILLDPETPQPDFQPREVVAMNEAIDGWKKEIAQFKQRLESILGTSEENS